MKFSAVVLLSLLAVSAFAMDDLKDSAGKAAKDFGEAVQKDASDAVDSVKAGAEVVREHAAKGVETVKDAASSAAEKVKDTAAMGAEKVREGIDQVKKTASDVKDAVAAKADDAVQAAKSVVNAKESSEEKDDEPVVAAASINAKGVQCYQCNSATKGQDKCDSSDDDDLKPFMKKCVNIKEGTFKGTEALGCRKIIQNIGDEEPVIIRECAFTGDLDLDGKKRTGNKGISMYYYQCQNTGDKPCNSAVSQFAGLATLFFGAVLAFF
ncbi:hypothetical protein L596_014713 [Steinernema carpocapsae]|uniref:Protein sleepless n=1 Tax=Steinernema carpocapsae TaxID=34508 RepID=A0A4U5NCP8_STECR|nr:hypothetical protein L596_014713 [Steinernema carpocapsae]